MSSELQIILVVLGLAIILYVTSLSSFKNWLVYAVSKAEKLFGSKTGKLKLRYVYYLAIEAYPLIVKLLPFSIFSILVDSSLKAMRLMIENNKEISDIIFKE